MAEPVESGGPPPSPNPFAAPLAPAEAQPTAVGYQPLQGLAKTLWVTMVGYVVVNVVSIVESLVTMRAMGRLLAGQDVAQAELEAIDTRSGTLAIAELIVLLTAVVLFCLIMPRANRNVRSFGIVELEFTPVWSALIFFVPIVNLWKPYFLTRDIWRASVIPPDPRVSWRFNEFPRLLPLWWWAYVLSNIVGQIAGRSARDPDGAEQVVTAAWINIAACVLAIAAGLLAAKVIGQLARLQQAKHEAQQASPPPAAHLAG